MRRQLYCLALLTVILILLTILGSCSSSTQGNQPPTQPISPMVKSNYSLSNLNYNTAHYKSGIAEGSVWKITAQSKNRPPTQPSNPSPADGATNVSTSTTLSWVCSDPDGDSLVYDVYFGTSSPPSLVKSNHTSTSYRLSDLKGYGPVNLNYSTTYYWKIVAKDNKGGVTEGPVWRFTTQSRPNVPPAQPSNPNPTNGATNIPINMTLSWTCSDPDGDRLVYDVYFGTSSPPPLVRSNHTSTSYSPGTLNYNTTYHWKIVAKDNRGGVTESPVWRFTTITIGALKWTYQTNDQILSSPAIGSDGTIYVGSKGGYVYALYPDGRLKWRFQTGGSVSSSPAIGSDGTIYVGSHDGYVYAINPNGTFRWGCQTDGEVRSSPAIGSDGTIYVGSHDGYVYAINPNGTLKWRYHTGNHIYSSPAIGADGTIYVGNNDGNLYAINPNGTLKWIYLTNNHHFLYSSPAIGADGTIYVGSFDRHVYALNPDGTLKWRYRTGDSVYSSPAIGADGTIYVGSMDGYVYALYPNGIFKWRYQTNDQVYSSPAIGADGTIYVGSFDRHVYALNPDGTLKWVCRTAFSVHSSPAIGPDGTVYVSNGDYVYAICSDSFGLANSSWPKFKRNNRNTGRIGDR